MLLGLDGMLSVPIFNGVRENEVWMEIPTREHACQSRGLQSMSIDGGFPQS